MYLACVHSDPFHFLPVWSLLSPQKAGPGLFRLKKIGLASDSVKGVKFSWQLWPQHLRMRSWLGWVTFTSRWQANKPGGEKTALAKWFDDTCSFVPLWNADCAIFFVKQDSHWVEDKQLFIKRNQELLEKVCGAQHPNGAEERLMRDPGAAGGPLRSGTGARGRGGFSGCAPLCCVPNRISVTAITISWVARGVHGSVLGIVPTWKMWSLKPIDLLHIYILYIYCTYIYSHTHTHPMWLSIYKNTYEKDWWFCTRKWLQDMLQPSIDWVLTVNFLPILAAYLCIYFMKEHFKRYIQSTKEHVPKVVQQIKLQRHGFGPIDRINLG